jgi:hypothetical protein
MKYILITYERNVKWIKLQCKIVFQIGFEHIEYNEVSYFYLYPFNNLVQVPYAHHPKNLFENFYKLYVNYNLSIIN